MMAKRNIVLNNLESDIIHSFLRMRIPSFVYSRIDGNYDSMECYEIAFTFVHDLLRGGEIDSSQSPWGGDSSVIFEPGYYKALESYLESCSDDDEREYCIRSIEVLAVLRAHSMREEGETSDGNGLSSGD